MAMNMASQFAGNMGGRKKPMAKKAAKVGKVMDEFKKGELRSGSKSGPKVKSPKQAKAIAMNEAGMSKKRRAPELMKDEKFGAR